MLTKLLQGLVICLALQFPAYAGIINPDFSAGAVDWIDLSGSGSVKFEQGQALLSTGSGTDPFSAVLMQGDDENGGFTFINAIAVPALSQFFSFDLTLLAMDVDSSESGSALFPDHLRLALYSESGAAFDLIFNNLIATSTAQLLKFDISALAGHNIIISFELSDEDDGFNHIFALDNLAFIERSQTVPSPAVLFLMLPAVGWLLRAQRAKH